MLKDVTQIYTLSDPVSGLVLYVGKSNNPKERYRRHIYEKTVTKKGSWIKNLLLNDLAPVMEVIDTVPMCDWEFWEKHYIKLYKSCGANLLNMNEGGNSAGASKETRQKQRLAKFGKKISIAVVEKMRAERERKRMTPKRVKKKRALTQVSSYDLLGFFINTYKSISDASRQTGAAKHVIIKICRKEKNYIQAKGMVFRFGNEAKIQDIPERKFSKQRGVIQMTLNGDFICEYKTVREASRKVGVTDPAIHAVCLGNRKTSKGFKWKYKQ